MKRFLGWFVVSLFLFVYPLTGAVAAANERNARILVAQKALQEKELAFEKQLVRDPMGGSVRDLPNAALIVLRGGGPPQIAEGLLERVFKLQNMNKDSDSFGTVPWKMSDTTVKDPNAIEFTMQPMGAIFFNYANKFSPAFLKEADVHLRAALVGMAHHNIKVSYTNIFLMNTTNTLMIAQYLHDDDAFARGKKQWQEWREYTRQNGIFEFNSPTYCATDLADLNYGGLYVKDPVIHAQIVEAEALFWKDIASHYFAGVDHLAGAHSRDYQFLTGRGSLDMNLYMEGLNPPGDDYFEDLYLEKVSVLENERPGGYHPSPEILDIARLPERVVELRHNANDAYQRYTYLTDKFAIGTATGSYCPQDKMFAVDLATESRLPVTISVSVDALGSEYGLNKILGKDGHSKPQHLPPNLSNVQDKGLALLVYDLNPTAAHDGNNFSTNLILPTHVDRLVLDDHAIKPSASLKEPAHLNSVLGLRMGASCFVARVFDVEALDGKAPTFSLEGDHEGFDHGAIRFVIQHSNSEVRSPVSRHVHVSMIAEASDCKDDAGLDKAIQRLHDATLTTSAKKDTWMTRATVGTRQLELVEDSDTRLPVSRKVNGIEVEHPVFRLNGKPVEGISAATP
jgi:hypothetical protein